MSAALPERLRVALEQAADRAADRTGLPMRRIAEIYREEVGLAWAELAAQQPELAAQQPELAAQQPEPPAAGKLPHDLHLKMVGEDYAGKGRAAVELWAGEIAILSFRVDGKVYAFAGARGAPFDTDINGRLRIVNYHGGEERKAPPAAGELPREMQEPVDPWTANDPFRSHIIELLDAVPGMVARLRSEWEEERKTAAGELPGDGKR